MAHRTGATEEKVQAFPLGIFVGACLVMFLFAACDSGAAGAYGEVARAWWAIHIKHRGTVRRLSDTFEAGKAAIGALAERGLQDAQVPTGGTLEVHGAPVAAAGAPSVAAVLLGVFLRRLH